MKKTLIALLALGCVSLGAEEAITLSTAASYTDGNGGTYSGVVFNLAEVNPSVVAQVPSSSEITSQVELTSISLTMRNNSGTGNAGTYVLYVFEQSTLNVVAVSSNTQTTPTTFSGQVLTFEFNDDVLTAGTTYCARFVKSDAQGQNLNADGTFKTSSYYSVQLAAVSETAGTTTYWGHNSKDSTNAAHNNFSPVMSISFNSVSPVPEPATGTLSLLALAGLCARRRRK